VAKVTSKLQLTLPKAIAERFGVRPGDEVDWVEADDAIRVVPRRLRRVALDTRGRLRLFDAASERIREVYSPRSKRSPSKARERGWTRDELYERDRAG
jgi:AbrB family looped-hinge helix DNA binding protein